LSLRGQEVLALLDAAEKDLLAQARADSGHLRIGFFASAGYRLLPQALSRFSGRYPGVEVDLVQGQRHELAVGVQQGAIDVLIAFEHALEPWELPEGVQAKELLHEPLHLVVPIGHPAGRRSQVRLQELAGEQWITSFGTGAPVLSVTERACALEGFTPNIRCRSDHLEVILGLVRAGMGIALMPTLGLSGTAGVETTRVLGPRLYRKVVVVSRPVNPNPLLSTFIAYLGGVASNLLTMVNRQRVGDACS
jgi:DNA-binding transcriptional LysR family regulator